VSIDALPRLKPRRRRNPPAWARARLEAPLYRNGYALIASSGLTSALGLVFWLVAARNYSPAAVGVGAALISAMTTVADLCQLNLKSALNRFLPRAGRTTNRLVVRSYLVALVVSGLAAVAFVAGLGIWLPRLAFLRDRPELGAWFVLATMAWTIFVLQDSVLTGIRQAVWVPLENLIYAIVKIVLLFALVVATPTLGTFVAWTATLPLLVVPVNVLLFRRLLPRHVTATRPREERIGIKTLVRYVAKDYAAYMMMTATMGLLPLIVLAVLGAKASAYYFVSWSIAYGLYQIASGMGMSMITEAAHDPTGLARYRRQSLVETAKLVVPCVALVVLAAPSILGLLGHGYSSAGVTLLRLMSLSAVPWIVFVTSTNAARVERRMGVVVGGYAALFGLVLAIGLPLLEPMGIDGLGVGWLAAQSIVAAAILASWLAHRPPTGLGDRAVRALSAARTDARRVRHRLTSAGDQSAVLAQLRHTPEYSEWVIQRDLRVLNDLAVSAVGPPGSAPVALVKRACSRAGQRSLWPHARALLLLRRIPGLTDWSRLVPRVLASGVAGRHGFIVESYMPGTTMEIMLEGGGGREQLLAEAAAAIKPLHDATSKLERVDEALLHDLIDVPVARVKKVVANRSRAREGERVLERLRCELRAELDGREAITTWVQGDLSPGNILMGSDGTVQAIVDWEQGRARGLPQLDLLQLLISTRAAVERREFGDVIAGMHLDPDWRTREQRVVRALQRHARPLPTRVLVLLAWLQHVSANLGKSGRYAHSRVWLRRNVDAVLASLILEPIPVPAPGAVPAPGRARPRSRTRGPRGVARGLWSSLATSQLELAASVGTLGLAVVLWLVSLPQIDPRAMTNLGLVSVIPPTFVLALVTVTASFVVLVYRRPRASWLLVAHLLALVVFTRATPTIVYGTLRYSWAWKHVGIVDYIARHGGVDPGIRYLSVYHNWPGFFGLDTLLIKLAGLPGTLALATWGPAFFNGLYLGALIFLFSGLTRDRRVVWVASWLFFVANWVGQDYFSPQAFAFLLYLLLLGVTVRWLGPRSADARPGRVGALCLAVLLLTAIAPSHALTSVMACIALTALVLGRASNARLLPFLAVTITAVWDLVFGWDYASQNFASFLGEVRLPWVTTGSSLTDIVHLDPDQTLVANVARGLSVAVAAIAVAGAVRQWRAGRLNRAAVILAAAPVVLFGTGNYDGEILFRIFLFSVPFLAFLAAHAFVGHRRRWTSPILTGVAATLVLGVFLVAYYGNERANYFTPGEVAAARYVDTHAPPRSLLIDGTNNYPFSFKNYERFAYVSIALEPPSSRSRVIASPVAVLSDWMSNTSYRAAYLIITRSQKIEAEEDGSMPAGSLDTIEHALLASPRFRVVFRNRDAIVFSLASSSTRSVTR
jgi:O-antigen/teichoic acid export membrane protein